MKPAPAAAASADIDPLTDPRLVNIPAPEPDPTPNRRHLKNLLTVAPLKYWAWETLGAVAAWGHLSTPLTAAACPRVPPEAVPEMLETLHSAGCLRRFTDCPKCREVDIWSLRPSHALKKLVSAAPARHQTGFYGRPPDPGLTPTDLVSAPKLAKHDLAAATLAGRLSKVLPAGWIFGARDARWSTLLRFPPPRVGATAFRQASQTGHVERWADLVYVSADGRNRVAVEVTVSNNRPQLARKARWWGVSIAERGGPGVAGLRVVILDAPGKTRAGTAICDAFPQSAGWDKGYRRYALEGVLSAGWGEWVDGPHTPAGENGWRAYQHTTPKTKHPLRLADPPAGAVGGYADGPGDAVSRKLVKGVFACGPGAAPRASGGC